MRRLRRRRTRRPGYGPGETDGGKSVQPRPVRQQLSPPDGKGGGSAVAQQKGDCTSQLVCTENGIVVRDSATNTVTFTGNATGGSSLECATSIQVVAGQSTVTFTYEFAEGTDPCGGGVPRLLVVIDGQYYTTFDGDTDCSEANGSTIAYTIPVTGTVTRVGLVYDRGDSGSVTYSNATVGDVTLYI